MGAGGSGDVSSGWLQRVDRGRGPIYLAILKALEEAIRAGELQGGDKLPPQRLVAEILGVDFTTVTRAYGTARERGWVEGAVGRGTFVSARALDEDPGLIDLSMNLPPPPEGVSLSEMLRDATATVLQRSDPARLMSYHPGAGAVGQQRAGAAWLAPLIGEVAADRVLLSSGAQTILAALLGRLARRGPVVVEPLTYPGLKLAAEQQGARLVPCSVDAEGFVPAELDRLCREARPSAIYLVPTMQNPTATTMSPERRRQVADLAKAHDVWVIEDDPYGRLAAAPPPAVATFAPEKTFYVATLSKCLSPGLRLAYLVCPTAAQAAGLADALRALTLMPAPLMAAVVTSWIRDGAAERLLAGVRAEAVARRQLARRILPQASAAAEESIHVWLDLPPDWGPEGLRQAAQARGLSLVTAESFAVGVRGRSGVRISLGGPESRAVLEDALQGVADLVGKAPETGRLVV